VFGRPHSCQLFSPDHDISMLYFPPSFSSLIFFAFGSPSEAMSFGIAFKVTHKAFICQFIYYSQNSRNSLNYRPRFISSSRYFGKNASSTLKPTLNTDHGNKLSILISNYVCFSSLNIYLSILKFIITPDTSISIFRILHYFLIQN
jgi:hypothetical protein